MRGPELGSYPLVDNNIVNSLFSEFQRGNVATGERKYGCQIWAFVRFTEISNLSIQHACPNNSDIFLSQGQPLDTESEVQDTPAPPAIPFYTECSEAAQAELFNECEAQFAQLEMVLICLRWQLGPAQTTLDDVMLLCSC